MRFKLMTLLAVLTLLVTLGAQCVAPQPTEAPPAPEEAAPAAEEEEDPGGPITGIAILFVEDRAPKTVPAGATTEERHHHGGESVGVGDAVEKFP